MKVRRETAEEFWPKSSAHEHRTHNCWLSAISYLTPDLRAIANFLLSTIYLLSEKEAGVNCSQASARRSCCIIIIISVIIVAAIFNH